MRGAARIVEASGGVQNFGLNGFIELLFHKYVDEVGLSSTSQDQVPSGSCGEVFRTYPISACA